MITITVNTKQEADKIQTGLRRAYNIAQEAISLSETAKKIITDTLLDLQNSIKILEQSGKEKSQ